MLGNSIARKLRAQTFLRLLCWPFQKVLDKPGDTHRYLTERAVDVLRSDGFTEASDFFTRWLPVIVKGNYWADRLWMNATHHYNPSTGKGLWIWASAPDQLRNWWRAAMSAWRRRNVEKSMFMLGACLHLVQDCCQPYHSNCVVLDGHQKYEQWADCHKEEFVVDHGGLYGIFERPEEWAAANAEASFPHLAEVCSPLESDRRRATALLIPRAVRTSAGFLMFFKEATEAAAKGRARERRIAVG